MYKQKLTKQRGKSYPREWWNIKSRNVYVTIANAIHLFILTSWPEEDIYFMFIILIISADGHLVYGQTVRKVGEASSKSGHVTFIPFLSNKHDVVVVLYGLNS